MTPLLCNWALTFISSLSLATFPPFGMTPSPTPWPLAYEKSPLVKNPNGSRRGPWSSLIDKSAFRIFNLLWESASLSSFDKTYSACLLKLIFFVLSFEVKTAYSMLNWQFGIFVARSSDNSNSSDSTLSQNGMSLWDYVIIFMSSAVGKYNRAFYRGTRLIACISTGMCALNSKLEIG